MQYDAKDVPQFKEDVCKKTCIQQGKCIEEEKNDHWFLMCPHYHSWKLGYTSFVWEQIEWEKEHPDEVEEKHKQNLELAKKMKEQKKKAKKNEEKV